MKPVSWHASGSTPPAGMCLTDPGKRSTLVARTMPGPRPQRATTDTQMPASTRSGYAHWLDAPRSTQVCLMLPADTLPTWTCQSAGAGELVDALEAGSMPVVGGYSFAMRAGSPEAETRLVESRCAG